MINHPSPRYRIPHPRRLNHLLALNKELQVTLNLWSQHEVIVQLIFRYSDHLIVYSKWGRQLGHFKVGSLVVPVGRSGAVMLPETILGQRDWWFYDCIVRHVPNILFVANHETPVRMQVHSTERQPHPYSLLKQISCRLQHIVNRAYDALNAVNIGQLIVP